VIDVTRRAIEETAAVIFKILDERQRTPTRLATLRG
jgi:regulator of PEP synthase PpsR (kinase-PPPase family)